MNFGPHTEEPDAFRIMDHALEHGIQFFDTANVYGRTAGRGATERIVGNWFAQGGKRREQVVLATKVYGRMDDGPNDARLSARHIRLACEESLQRLHTDFIDVYQMHHIDRDTPWDEVWQAMDQLVRQGKVLYVGSSNFAGWQIAQACERATQRGSLGLVSEQSLYNLNARTVELEVIPACRSYGLGLLPWSPLGSGLLGGVLDKREQGRRVSDFVKERLERDRPRIEAYETLCAELGQAPGEVALAWLLHNPVVTAPIIGPRTLDQLESALKATELRLARETLQRLDKLFPGPGGEAPEAYAW
jgi:aryl-alcohol dehydrogenase-like predicted oxidoreductase